MSGSPTGWFLAGATLLRTYGCRGLVRRAVHELRKRAGSFVRQPPNRDYGSSSSDSFVYRPAGEWLELPAAELDQIVARGRRVIDGWYEAYGHEWRRYPSAERQWRTHPTSGFEFPLVDWWRLPLLPSQADIKDVWEPGRFGWVYDLIRAYMATRERAYADAFHQRLPQWLAANPPFRGPHWACGQETAIRALAILHAQDSLPAPAGSAGANELILKVLGWSGERIADAIGYGLSQRNNHGISEAAGLVHLGLRLRGAHPKANDWLRAGRALLEEQILDQFAADGWYAQHSFTYMRVALEQALCAQRALAASGASLSEGALSRLDAAVGLLLQVVDASSGVVPNLGANDGARILPLTPTDYRDFRPLLTLAAVIRQLPLPADVPVNRHVVRWLGASPPAPGPARVDRVARGASGWAVVRFHGWSVFLRAGRYRHRPSHLDSLHLDVRCDGREIVTDAGTYAYNAPPPWNNGLTSGRVHNAPILDDQEPARRGPRFLWLSWPKSVLLTAEGGSESMCLVAERDESVRREVVITKDAVHVCDRALTASSSSMQVTWLLHPEQAHRGWVCAEGAQRIEASDQDLAGWFSPTYGLRQRSAAIRVRRANVHEQLRIDTVIERPGLDAAGPSP
jgi:Heparinase II/III-like protein/Heparinase II/III N-terminus